VCDVELQFEKAMMNEVKNVKKRERECEKKNENQPPWNYSWFYVLLNDAMVHFQVECIF